MIPPKKKQLTTFYSNKFTLERPKERKKIIIQNFPILLFLCFEKKPKKTPQKTQKKTLIA
jgi:hypothetical protein